MSATSWVRPPRPRTRKPPQNYRRGWEQEEEEEEARPRLDSVTGDDYDAIGKCVGECLNEARLRVMFLFCFFFFLLFFLLNKQISL